MFGRRQQGKIPNANASIHKRMTPGPAMVSQHYFGLQASNQISLASLQAPVDRPQVARIVDVLVVVREDGGVDRTPESHALGRRG